MTGNQREGPDKLGVQKDGTQAAPRAARLNSEEPARKPAVEAAGKVRCGLRGGNEAGEQGTNSTSRASGRNGAVATQ